MLSRKKTLLSIGKLALIAGGTGAESEDIGDINRSILRLGHYFTLLLW